MNPFAQREVIQEWHLSEPVFTVVQLNMPPVYRSTLCLCLFSCLLAALYVVLFCDIVYFGIDGLLTLNILCCGCENKMHQRISCSGPDCSRHTCCTWPMCTQLAYCHINLAKIDVDMLDTVRCIFQ